MTLQIIPSVDNHFTTSLCDDYAVIIINPSRVDHHGPIVGVKKNHDNKHDNQNHPEPDPEPEHPESDS